MTKETTYKEAGVDIEAGDAFVHRIRGLVESTSRPGVRGAFGGFSAVVSLPDGTGKTPLLVSSVSIFKPLMGSLASTLFSCTTSLAASLVARTLLSPPAFS